uniref:Uncharacterized protein n=1 Tax=Rhizophora mucronata TaxID=61149 RepID=A0A2P2PR43_RHIMU
MSLGITVRLLHCDLEVIGLSHLNSLFVKAGVRLHISYPFSYLTLWEPS